jgi:hypothetical protein
LFSFVDGLQPGRHACSEQSQRHTHGSSTKYVHRQVVEGWFREWFLTLFFCVFVFLFSSSVSVFAVFVFFFLCFLCFYLLFSLFSFFFSFLSLFSRSARHGTSPVGQDHPTTVASENQRRKPPRARHCKQQQQQQQQQQQHHWGRATTAPGRQPRVRYVGSGSFPRRMGSSCTTTDPQVNNGTCVLCVLCVWWCI